MKQNGSCECSKSELNVLSVPPTMTAMQESQWIEHVPIASLANNAPVQFIIPPETEHWTDLSQSYLYVKFKIIKADGHDLELNSNVAPVNNFLHNMFSNDIHYSFEKHMIEELRTLIAGEVYNQCYGCQMDHPSHRQHELCLFKTRQEQTDMFIVHGKVVS